MLPLTSGVRDHQTVFVRGLVLLPAKGGGGSVDSVVAAELSTVVVPWPDTAIALVKLSFGGRAPVTVRVCEADSPAVGDWLVTFTDATVPYATRVCETVAVIVVVVPPGSIVTPNADPFQRICAFAAKLLPFAVRVKSADPAAAEVGLMEFSVGVEPDETWTEDHEFTMLVASKVPSPVAMS